MTQIAFPFRLNSAGTTASATDGDHMRQLLEQVLFTTPGERVNRPDFGCGLCVFPFEPASLERLAMLETLIKANIEQWLGDLLRLSELSVSVEDATATIIIGYVIQQTGKPYTDMFQVEVRT